MTADPWQSDALNDGLGEKADGKWASREVAIVVSRQNGKGSILEIRTLAGLNLFDERLILWSAHETKTAFEAFARFEALVTQPGAFEGRIKRVTHGNGAKGVEMSNGARLLFVARTKGSGRGFSADLVILDEAYALTAEQIEALIPTLSARPNPQIWYTSSPPLTGDTGDQLYSLRERALAKRPGLTYLDWGIQGVDLLSLDEIDLDDSGLYRLANPAMGHRGSLSLDTIRAEREAMSDEGFARERLGIWPRRITGGEGSPITEEMWATLLDAAAAKPDAPRPLDIVFALDVNPARTHSAIVACGMRSDGHYQLAVTDYRAGTEWCVSRLAELRDRYEPLAFAVDAKGPAGPLLLDLAEAGFRAPADPEKPKRGQLAIPDAGGAAQAYGLIVDAVRQGRIRHLGDAPLTTAVLGAKVRPLSGGGAWDRKAGVDIAPLVAGTLAHWGFVTREHLARRGQYDLLSSVY